VAHKLSWFSTDHVGVLLPKIKKKSQKYQRTVGYPSTSWASCFIPHLHSTPSEYCHKVLLPDREKKSEDMITRFDRNHERDRRTDGQTDTAWRHRPHFHSIAPQWISQNDTRRVVHVYTNNLNIVKLNLLRLCVKKTIFKDLILESAEYQLLCVVVGI